MVLSNLDTFYSFVIPHVVANPCVYAASRTKLHVVSVIRRFNCEFDVDVAVLKRNLALIASAITHLARLADVATQSNASTLAVAWS
jgi:hypothetical protein